MKAFLTLRKKNRNKVLDDMNHASPVFSPWQNFCFVEQKILETPFVNILCVQTRYKVCARLLCESSSCKSEGFMSKCLPCSNGEADNVSVIWILLLSGRVPSTCTFKKFLDNIVILADSPRDDSNLRWHFWKFFPNSHCPFVISMKFSFSCLMGSWIPFGGNN